ncbi:MAG TPA: hypothetical protein VD963_01180, partial [Phycisphaerales bacterium]|nr:hypothetical protein [Phycisphaerales bacterium]
SVKEFVREMFKQADAAQGQDGLFTWLGGLVGGDEGERPPEPAGPVGLAAFVAKVTLPGDADKKITEPRDRLQMLLVADFGAGAEEAHAFVERALDDLRADGKVTLDDDEHEGVAIRVVAVVPGAKDNDEAAENGPELGDDDENGMDFRDWEAEPDPFGDALGRVLVARAGSVLVASTHRPALEQALDRIAGRRVEALAETPAWRDTLAQHPDGLHAALAFFLTDWVRSSLGEMFEGAFLPPGGAAGFIGALGLTDVTSFSVGVRLNPGQDTLEQTIGLLAPRKSGLLGLLDASLPRLEPPGFAPADASDFTALALRFDRVIPLMRELANAAPEEMREQAQAGVAAAEAQAGPVLASLVGDVYLYETISRPLGPASQHVVLAVRLRDPLPLANTLSGLAGLGLEPRDFQGNQVFDMDPDSDESVSIGIGHGFAIVSGTEQVESALRLAAQPDAPRLAADERFRAAIAGLPPGGMMYSFTDTAQKLEWSLWMMRNAPEVAAHEIDEMDFDPETREEMLRHARESQPAWLAKAPPAEVLIRHLGDTALSVRATPDGFRGRSVMLPPRRR